MGKVNMALGAVTLSLAVALGVLVSQLRAERALISTHQSRIESLERSASSAPAPQMPARQESPLQVASPSSSASSVAAPSGASSSGAKHPEALKDPQYRAAAVAQRKIYARHELRDLPRWMRISGREMDSLIELVGEHEVEEDEMLIATRGARGSDQARRQREAMKQRQDSEFAQLLGYQRFEEWKAYREAAGARSYLEEMNENLLTGDLLPPEQVRPIATAMTQAARGMDEDVNRSMASAEPKPDAAAQWALAERRVQLAYERNERVRAAAARALSAKQLAALDNVIQQKQEEMKASLAVQRARIGTRQ